MSQTVPSYDALNLHDGDLPLGQDDSIDVEFERVLAECRELDAQRGVEVRREHVVRPLRIDEGDDLCAPVEGRALYSVTHEHDFNLDGQPRLLVGCGQFHEDRESFLEWNPWQLDGVQSAEHAEITLRALNRLRNQESKQSQSASLPRAVGAIPSTRATGADSTRNVGVAL